jgi:hypothetical protein
MQKSLFLITIISCICLIHAKAPVNIDPKNPSDPKTLPAGVTKKVLVIGNFNFLT